MDSVVVGLRMIVGYSSDWNHQKTIVYTLCAVYKLLMQSGYAFIWIRFSVEMYVAYCIPENESTEENAREIS